DLHIELIQMMENAGRGPRPSVLRISENPQTRSLKFPTPETLRVDSDIREAGRGSPQAGGDEANQPEGAPPHDLKGRRRGSRRIEEAGMVHRGHLPPPWTGSQDDPGLPER